MSPKKKLLYKIGSGCLCMWMCGIVVMFALYTLDGIFGINMMDVWGGPKSEKSPLIGTNNTNSSKLNTGLTPAAVPIDTDKSKLNPNFEKLDCKAGYFQRGLFCELCSVAEPGCLECTQDTS